MEEKELNKLSNALSVELTDQIYNATINKNFDNHEMVVFIGSTISNMIFRFVFSMEFNSSKVITVGMQHCLIDSICDSAKGLLQQITEADLEHEKVH